MNRGCSEDAAVRGRSGNHEVVAWGYDANHDLITHYGYRGYSWVVLNGGFIANCRPVYVGH